MVFYIELIIISFKRLTDKKNEARSEKELRRQTLFFLLEIEKETLEMSIMILVWSFEVKLLGSIQV